jgi:hypothetical protein
VLLKNLAKNGMSYWVKASKESVKELP